MKKWTYGGIIGLVVGIVMFFITTRNQFARNISELSFWGGFIIIIAEPAIAGALIFFAYEKLSKLKLNKIIFWVIFSLLTIGLIYFTIWWFIALDLVTGIVGL